MWFWEEVSALLLMPPSFLPGYSLEIQLLTKETRALEKMAAPRPEAVSVPDEPGHLVPDRKDMC